jgi:hypothetical protein
LNKLAVAHSLTSVALVGAAIYFYAESRRMGAETLRLGETVDRLVADDARLRERLQSVESQLAEAKASLAASGAFCDRVFPSGFYRLETNTNYGAKSVGAYEIYHVSLLLSQWNINVGTRLSGYGIPTDFYVDYDGDGRIDTALAARFVREIPLAGNTFADRLLADSRVHQNLYGVFSCEWRNAEFTSAEDMNAKVSGTSNMLWELVQKHSADLVEWIGALYPEMAPLGVER